MRLIKKDISRKWYIILLVVFIMLKLIASFAQMVEINVNAPIDDTHYYETALSIGQGNWLGEYNWYTLAKGMFFSVWLWMLNVLHIPYLVGGQLLFLSGIAIFIKALNGYLIKRRTDRLIIFCFFWFMPYSWASFTLRVYRDNILPYLCLLMFAGFTGIILRTGQSWKKSVPFALSAGLGVGLAYLTREDAMWLFPFAVCAFLFCILFGFLKKDRKKIIDILAPVLITVAICFSSVGVYCGMNYRYYGYFGVNEISAPEFNRALSLMVSCEEDLPHTHKIICKDTRLKISGEVPMMAELCEVLDNGSYYHGYQYDDEQEFNSNGFFWMFKKAAYDMGVAGSPSESEAYWKSLADEIQAAVDEGRLSSVKIKGLAAISPYIFPYDSSFLKPVLSELWNSVRTLTFFEQNSSLPPLSMVNEETGKEWEHYLNSLFSSRYAEAGTDNVEYFFPQITVEIIYTVILWIYRILFWPLVLYSIYSMIRETGVCVRQIIAKDTKTDASTAIMMLGVFLSFLLRTSLVSYIEVTNFHLGTYLMYLSAAGMTLFVFAGFGLIMLLEKNTSEQL